MVTLVLNNWGKTKVFKVCIKGFQQLEEETKRKNEGQGKGRHFVSIKHFERICKKLCGGYFQGMYKELSIQYDHNMKMFSDTDIHHTYKGKQTAHNRKSGTISRLSSKKF